MVKAAHIVYRDIGGLDQYYYFVQPMMIMFITKLCNNLSGFFHFPKKIKEIYHGSYHDDCE